MVPQPPRTAAVRHARVYVGTAAAAATAAIGASVTCACYADVTCARDGVTRSDSGSDGGECYGL